MFATLISVEIDQLMPDPTQPRQSFLKDEIDRLAASISARGVLQPLRIQRDEERRCWRIVTGECRWRAARQAGLTHVPCLQVEGELSEADRLADQIIENTVRHSVLPIQQARAIAKLKALTGTTSQQIAAELGISGSSITRTEALLSLPEEIQQMVDDGIVPESTAYELSKLPDGQAQLELARLVAAKSLSRDQVAEAVRDRVGRKEARPKASRLAYRLAEGVSVTVAAAEPLTWDGLLAALDGCRKAAKKLYEGGEDVTAFGKAMKG